MTKLTISLLMKIDIPFNIFKMQSTFKFKSKNTNELFSLENKVAIITGGAGLLGIKHAEAIIEMGGTPVLLDIDKARISNAAETLSKTYSKDVLGIKCDITSEEDLIKTSIEIIKKYNRIDILINNAANNPKVKIIALKTFLD